jgi:hypothetical protein
MIVNKYANGNGGGGGTGSTVTVDAALSSSSTNPVENRVITNALSEYTTNEYVESRFDSAEAYTDSQVNNLEEALSAAITAATENMATQDYVDTAINEELQGYATEAYVDNAITAATQNYVTSGDVATAITAATQNFATEQYVDDAIADMATVQYVDEVISATEAYVDGEISGATQEIYEYIDAAILTGATITVDDALSTASTNPVENRVIANKFGDYYTKSEVDNQFTTAATAIGNAIDAAVQGLASEQYVDNAVSGMASEDYVDAAVTAATQNFVTEQYVTNVITAATQNLVTEEYVDNAIASAITVDDALSTASTNPVENRVIANKFADYVTKLELTGDTETVELELGERNNNYTYKFAYGIMMPTVASGSMKDTNVDSIKAIRIGDETSSMPMDDGVSLYYFNLNGTNYIPANNTIGSKVSLVQGGSSASASVQYSSITAREMDGYYFIVDLSDMTVLVTNTLPTITTGTPGILDDYVTSGDVEDMIEDVVATAITIDSALSTGSTNPVQNQVITNALANFVQSTSVRTIVKCTQAEYDAMQSHDPNTFYIITGVNS